MRRKTSEIAAGLAAAGIFGAAGIFSAAGILGDERLVHNAANGSSASSALGAAAEATINLAGRTWRYDITGERPADVVVAQYVTGTDNHTARSRLVSIATIAI
jgi:hypothetical protein